MELEELVVGVKKANLSELKELKVKLPVRLLVNLHYVKLTQSRAISEVVNEALTQYFSEFVAARPQPPPAPSPEREIVHVQPTAASRIPVPGLGS